MRDLNDFRYFVEIVERGGFSAASRALQRPTSTLSNHIRQLERELGVTLLARSSRRVVMTQAGEDFYKYAAAVIERAMEAETVMRNRSSEARGTVRYAATMDVAQFAMSGMLASFMARYPAVKLIQHLSDVPVDIIADRYDVAIRAHSEPLPDSRLIQRSLVSDAPWHLFASPGYLQQTGPFAAPADLRRSETLLMKRNGADPGLRLTSESDRGAIVALDVQPRMLGVCMVTLRRAAEAGLGIVALPAYVCRDEVRAGRLRRVLPGWLAAESRITALMPHRHGMTAATRAFIDHLAAAFPAAVGLGAGDPDGNTGA
ncbi:MAG TPA: LysR substrate-binding domain-containing protein [Roseomonas sp.]|jgi:DNA-binding transcriptional LysR family regulator